MNSLKKILFLIDYKFYILFFLLFLFILISLFEIISLALLTPFLSLIAGSGNLDSYFLTNLFFIENIDRNNLIIFFGSIILTMIILKSFFTLFCWYLVYYFTWQNVISLRIKLVDIYKNIDYEKYIKKTSTEYIQNITVLSGHFTKQTLIPLMQLLSDLILAISISLFLLFTDIYIFLSIIILLILFSLTFGVFLKRKLIFYGQAINDNALKVLNGVKNLFQGYKEVKVYNKSEFFRDSIIDGTKKTAKYQIKVQVFNRLPRAILEIIVTFITMSIVFFYFIANEYQLSEILPKLVIFVIAAMRLGPAAAAINVSLNQLKIGKFALDKLYLELYEMNKFKSKKTDLDNLQNFKDLYFDNVSYAYPGTKKMVLENISFKISKGDIIGIFGGSGAGKTTCIDLLLGFLKPIKGKILYNGETNLSEKYINSFQKIIGYIPQDIFIINDSIKKNITLDQNNENLSSNFNRALKSSSLEDFVSNQERGSDSHLGDNGVNISGGQKQRISLARAIFHNREILILDEATNALDEITERKIINDIHSMKKDKTILIISHNSNILNICDKIIILENGKVKNIDTYENIFHANK